MNCSSIDIIEYHKRERALIFLDKIKNEKDNDKKLKLLIEMITYYDKVNANTQIGFLIDLLQDENDENRNKKIKNKITELNKITEGKEDGK